MGPYSLMSRVPGACFRQNATSSAASASPPMTNAAVLPAASAGFNCSANSLKCAGVSFTTL